MTVEQILKLIEAGFTKADISAMTTAPEPKPEPKQEPEPEPKQEPKPEPVVSRETSSVTDALNDIKQMIQKMNITGMTMATNGERTTDDILASIINPPKGDK